MPAPPESARTDTEAAESLDDTLRRIEGELDGIAGTAGEAARRQGAAIPGRNGRSTSDKSGAGNREAGKAGRTGKEEQKADDRDGTENAREKDAAADREQNGKAADETQQARRSEEDRRAGKETDGRPVDPGKGPGAEKDKEDSATADDRKGAEGSDDDVLARQLREAAEREQDPVLKEKLWAEYRKYKAAL